MSEKSKGSFNIALIGAGNWGKNFVSSVPRLMNLKLVAVCSRRQDLTLPNGCSVFSSVESLLKVHDLDGIIIATPPDTHAELTAKALGRGLPVLIEKPFCLDPVDAKSLSEMALERRIPVLVDFIHIFSPAYLELKKILAERLLKGARIVGVKSEGGNRGPIREGYSPLWDYGPHDLAMLFDLVGTSFDEYKLIKESLASSHPHEANYELELDYFNFVAKIRCGNCFQEKKRVFSVSFDDGCSIVFDDLAKAKLIVVDASGICEPVAISDESPMNCVLKEFSLAIESGLQHRSLKLASYITEFLEALEKRLVKGNDT